MAQQFAYNLKGEIPISTVVQSLSDKLAGFGYVTTQLMANDNMTQLNISKTGSDLEKFAGMLPECNLMLNRMNDQIFVNIEPNWMNKILAMAVGWFLCGIGLVTGGIGAYRQSNMTGEIQTMLMSTIGELNN